MKTRQGFTLIELLVVVLIIGILSSVALPQYTKSVEKARLAEVLTNIKTIQNNFQMFRLENPSPSNTCLKDMGGAGELTGGEWVSSENCMYQTKNFRYDIVTCDSSHCYAEICRLPNHDYCIVLDGLNGKEDVSCFTEQTDIGRFICKSLESQGFQYFDADF